MGQVRMREFKINYPETRSNLNLMNQYITYIY